MLQLEKSKGIKDIYKWINKINQSNFKLMGNFPRRIYEI